MSSKVYMVQRPSFRDPKTKNWIPKFDLKPAEQFGEVIVVFEPGNITIPDLPDAVEAAKEKLKFITTEDYILASMGDPVASALLIAVATQKLDGVLNILKYSKESGVYFPVKIAV